MQGRTMAISNSRFKVTVSQLIDILSILCLIVFSTRDYVSRLLPSLPYMTLGYLLLFALLAFVVLSKKRLNLGALLFLVCVVAVCLFSWVFTHGLQKEYIFSIILEPFAFIKLWVYFIIFSLVRDPEKFRRHLITIAFINMLLLILTTVSGLYAANGRALNYVGLGISGAMWIPLITLQAFITEGRKRNFYIATALIFIAFVAIYGNRGSLIAIIGFIVFCFLRYTKLKYKFWIAGLIAAITGIVYVFQDSIRTYIISKVTGFGLFSRNINLLIGGQLSYTTHRTDEIWVRVLEAIKSNWFTGYGLCYDRVLNGSVDVYAHNLILEVLLSFGVFVGFILLILHFGIGVRNCINNKNPEWEFLFAPFYVTSTLLLMFNNSFCLLSFFWIPYGVYYAYKKQAKSSLLLF